MKLKPLAKLDKKKKVALYVALNLALLACVPLFYIYREVAAEHPALFECHFLRSTGLYCPGCGATRALSALLEGRPITALRANPGLVCGGALIVWLDIRLGMAALERRPFVFGRLERVWSVSLASLLLGWAILRNLLRLGFGIDLLSGI